MPRKKVNETKVADNFNDGSNHDIMDEINQQLTEADEYVAKKMKRGENSTVDSSEVQDIFTDEIISQHGDEKSMDDETAQNLDNEAKQSFLENDVFDAIVKFMKTDDIISEKEAEHREMISPLKKQRSSLEGFLIDYLEQIDQEFIKIGEKTQLTKVETESKLAIKPENVAEALLEGFKKHELYTDDQRDEMMRVIKDMMTIVESKRERKIRKKIARVDLEKEEKKKAAKEAKQKKNDSIARDAKIDAKIDAKAEKIEKSSKSKNAKKATKGATKSAQRVTKTRKN
jgi:hypothetical protein